ncbi:MAG: four helix bundle protein [Anaerolineales bacterium]|nr:four helix bundle protein [Anaerolineales bacterium]
MPFKFEKLEVWQMALDYVDLMYELVSKLPDDERFNLKSQTRSAATSLALNIAEGSTGQSDPEQRRFLGMALRSLIETVACQRLIQRQKYVTDKAYLEHLDLKAQELAKRIQAFRKALSGSSPNRSIGEDQPSYDADEI